jgi:hypothetical protein
MIGKGKLSCHHRNRWDTQPCGFFICKNVLNTETEIKMKATETIIFFDAMQKKPEFHYSIIPSFQLLSQ